MSVKQMRPLKKGQRASALELAALAKRAREQAGRTRQEAAKELGVTWLSVLKAEEEPYSTHLPLRRQMIKRYSGLAVAGPFFELTKQPGPNRAYLR